MKVTESGNSVPIDGYSSREGMMWLRGRPYVGFGAVGGGAGGGGGGVGAGGGTDVGRDRCVILGVDLLMDLSMDGSSLAGVRGGWPVCRNGLWGVGVVGCRCYEGVRL